MGIDEGNLQVGHGAFGRLTSSIGGSKPAPPPAEIASVYDGRYFFSVEYIILWYSIIITVCWSWVMVRRKIYMLVGRLAAVVINAVITAALVGRSGSDHEARLLYSLSLCRRGTILWCWMSYFLSHCAGL